MGVVRTFPAMRRCGDAAIRRGQAMAQVRFEDARRFLYAEGRLLERRLFEVHFGSALAGDALLLLRGYRNPDGGYGHGLEPDKRVPDSQPLDVETALQIMDALGSVEVGVVAGACGFLERLGPGVGLLTGAYAGYPTAAHWGEWALEASLNPTAGIAGLLWKWGVEHPWRSAATTFCWERIEAGLPDDAHGFGEVLTFLGWVPDRERAARVAAQLPERLASLGLFRHDPASSDYGLTPLHFAPSPGGPWAYLFEPEVVEAHLVALAAAQQDDGGWPISWDTIGPAAVSEWRGIETLRALRTLRAYGRID